MADAVVVSAGTALRENYRPLALREEFRVPRMERGLTGVPALVTLTSSPERAELLVQTSDLVVMPRATAIDHASVLAVGNQELNFRELRTVLSERGLVRVAVEGGPRLINNLIASNVLDELALTLSPIDGDPTSDDFGAIDTFLSTHQSRHLFSDNGFEYSMFGTAADWKTRLTAAEFKVLRQHGTEPAFSAAYEKAPAPGYYRCRACGNRLFDASDQFDARCGWPAFWKPSRDDGVELYEDRSLYMRRTEVRCKACDSHLGHVFYGEGFGFATDARYCINAICLERVQD